MFRSSMVALRPTGMPSRRSISTLPGWSSAPRRSRQRVGTRIWTRRLTIDLVHQNRFRARVPRNLGNVGEHPLPLLRLIHRRERVARLLVPQHAHNCDWFLRLQSILGERLFPACLRDSAHQTRWSVLRLTELALDESSVDQNRILAFAANQGRKDVVSELPIAGLWTQLDRMLVVERSRHEHLAPRKLGNCRRAVAKLLSERLRT